MLKSIADKIRYCCFVAVIMHCAAYAQLTFAATCGNVWPAATTATSPEQLSLPTFTGTSALTLNATLGSGDFHYGTTSLSENTLTVSGGPSTRMYFNGSLSLSGQADINPGGDPEDLIIVVNGSISIAGQVEIKALIYATGSISISGQANIQGAVTALGTVSTTGSASVTYDAAAVSAINSSTLCTSTSYTDPEMAYAGAACDVSNQVVVQFASGSDKQALNSSTVTNTSNYSLTRTAGGSIGINSITYNSASNQAVLTLAASMSSINEYRIAVSGIEDSDGRTITASNDDFYFSTTKNGLVGAYYRNNTGFSGSPTLQVDSTVNESWSSTFGIVWESPWGLWGATKWSMRWHGFVVPGIDGDHFFQTYSDDGVRLYVEDFSSAIINNWTDHSGTTNTAAASTLVADTHYPVQLDYYNRESCGFFFCSGTDGDIQLRWTNPSGVNQVIPSSNLQTCIVASTAVTLGSFTFNTPTNASTCAAASVTVTAIGSDSNTLTTYTDSINLSTSSNHGDWALASGNGTLVNGTADDGAATYTFAATDNGTVTFNLNNTHADVLTVTAADLTAGVSDTSSAITFTDNILQIDENDNLNWDVVAGRGHDFTISYLRKEPDPSTTTCGVPDYDGTVTLQFYRTVTGNDPGGTAPTITSQTVGGNLGSAASVDIAFSDGVGQFTLASTDVGQYSLEVQDATGTFVKDSGGGTINVDGSSLQTVTVRPFGLYLRHVDNSSPASSNPGATDHNGNAFVKAGETFKAIVTGVRYESVDDQSPVDGYPDGHNDNDPATGADLSNNATTASFGNEGESVYLTMQLVAPSGGVTGNLAGTTTIGSFSSGIGSTINLTYDEVGIIEFTAGLDGDGYLATNRAVYGQSGYVGRFYPDHFDIALTAGAATLKNGTGTWDCAFTYQGQAFEYDIHPAVTISAKNSANTTTENYTGDYWKLSGLDYSYAASNLPAGAATTLSYSGGSLTLNDTGSGEGEVEIDNDQLTFTRVNVSPDSGDIPFDPTITLTLTDGDPGDGLEDADGACYEVAGSCANYTLTTTAGATIRYGRLFLDSGYGPETLDVLMSYRAEYWSALGANYGFVINSDDNASGCIGTGVTGVSLTGLTNNLDAGETSATLGSLSDGEGVVTLSAPGDGNDGQVTVTLDGPDWLEYDYDGDGSLDEANGTATFGIYGGREPILHLRETYR